MNSYFYKFIFAAFVVYALTGCQEETFTLLSKDGQVLGSGTIDASGLAHVHLSGTEYTGNWKTSNIYDEALAKRHRLAGTRSYEAYMLGNTPDQLQHGHALLTSSDGAELICDVFYQRQPRLGNCIINGESLELSIKQASEKQ